MMVPGPDRSIALARKIQVDVMFLKVDDSAKVVETNVGLFSETE